jgi:carbonic anhydrase
MNLYRIGIVATLVVFAAFALAADDRGDSVSPVTYKLGITMTKAVQASISPEQAITILKAGNERFQSGKQLKRDVKKLVQQTAFGQSPFASIVACTDSRSSPEVIFDQNIGDIFVARVAGNVANDDIIGSLEYASKVAGSRVIVVLGHTDCGAVKGACDNVILGNLTGLLGKIQPAVNAAKTSGDRNSKNYEFVEEVTEINVDDTIKAIREHSLILKELEEQGKIKIVGAIYDTSNGKIRWR